MIRALKWTVSGFISVVSVGVKWYPCVWMRKLIRGIKSYMHSHPVKDRGRHMSARVPPDPQHMHTHTHTPQTHTMRDHSPTETVDRDKGKGKVQLKSRKKNNAVLVLPYCLG